MDSNEKRRKPQKRYNEKGRLTEALMSLVYDGEMEFSALEKRMLAIWCATGDERDVFPTDIVD